MHSEFVVKNGESPRDFFIAIGDVSALLYVKMGSHLYAHYRVARENLPEEPFVMDAVEVSASSVIVGRGNFQHSDGKRRGDHCIFETRLKRRQAKERERER